MLYRSLAKHKAWWDSRASRRCNWSEFVSLILLPIWYPPIFTEPANDRDHLKW